MIKKAILTAFVIFILIPVFAQQKSFDVAINWRPVRVFQLDDEHAVSMLDFDGAIPGSGIQPMPVWSVRLALPPGTDFINATLSDEVFVPLTSSEAALIDTDILGGTVKLETAVRNQRYQPYGFISFYPIFKDPVSNTWQKLVSATISYDHGTHQQVKNNRAGQRSYTSSSVLAPGSGDWYKIAILDNGVYRIDYDFLNSIGVDLTNLASDAINIFGNSFGMLPEFNGDFRPDDLLKNAIYMHDGGDGVFDSGDYLLFYGKAAHQWYFNTSGNNYYHQKDYYCDTSYYFININVSSPTPKRIPSVAASSAPVTHTVTSFDDMKFIESDAVNFIKSGREWYGDLFDFVTEYNYSFSFPNIDVSQNVSVKADMAAMTPGSGVSSFTISVPGTSGSMTINIPGVGSGAYTAAANAGNATMTFLPAGSTVTVKTDFNKYSSSAQGWTNYIEVIARRLLIADGKAMEFRDHISRGAGNVADYHISSNDPALQVWEVTDPSNSTQIQTQFTGVQHNFVMNSDSLRTYVALSPDEITDKPVFVSRTQNQDLHALSPTQLIIISHPNFLNQANQLAQFHASEGVTSQVVTTTEVYNEFSSGMKDATAIKQFLRMFYDRAAGDTTLLPKYVCLFGDGSYDNKDRPSGNTSYIPTYQSVNSTYITISFVSDDYFVMLDPNENMGNSDQLDMAVGRLPVQSSTEAQAVVNKIIAYSTNVGSLNTGNAPDCCNQAQNYSLGDWRNLYTFIADDQDADAYINAAEKFADSLKARNNFININKIFLDAYLQVSTPGGERYPQVNEDIKDQVEKGSLVVNYIGHGGEVGWAHERILDVTTINAWTNSPRLPLFMTATCEFSRFDDPTRTSAGEYVLLNQNGGGIALLTTTRLVYSGPNEILNNNFNDKILQQPNGYGLRLGDVFMYTKNKTITQIASSNTRNFTLLGDPAVQVRVPHQKVVADSVNSVVIGGATDTLKALSQITISGHVEDNNGTRLTGYNGLIYPTVYDKEQTLYTLGNDADSPVRSFDLRKNIIYKGKATVVNGEFTFSFVVPKDINYQYGAGKLSFYVQNGSDDGTGGEFDIIVGGNNTNAPTDNTGPLIELYLDDENFVSGGMTDQTPQLYVKVSDENGINTVGTGIGHDITAILDGNTANPIVLNDAYQSDINTYKSGTVTYQFNSLSEGSHTLKFKVWDVYNNSSEAETEFVVAKSAEIALDHVLNYPNPFTTHTQFFFEHNQVCNTLDVQIQIFTVSGKLVKTIWEQVATEGYRISPIDWDGRDDYGDRLAIGTYIYRVKVKTSEGNTIEKFEKLVILN